MAEAAPQPGSATPDDFYRRLFEHATVAMIATDERFTVVLLNEAAGELLGLSPAAAIGKPIADIVPQQRRKLLGRLLERTLLGRSASQFDVKLPQQDGTTRDLLVTLSPIGGAAGQTASGVAAWVIDQTAGRKMQQRLAQAEKMASLGSLARGVAHHFNNILGGVATFVDFALASGDVPAMKRALAMMADAAAKAGKVTQSLLSFSKHDGSRSDLADLTEVVLTFAHLVERPLAERNIKLQLDLHPAAIIEVEANRMHQVLGNLLTNSEEAMPDGGLICISVSQRESEVVVSFADTGEGIKPEHQPLVFEPFFTTKGLAGGEKANPGLGLSVVHGIVMEMGGRIELDSQVATGTKFNMTFPVPTHGQAG